MAPGDRRPSKPSSSRFVGIRTLADLNRPSNHDLDDSDGAQEFYTGGEKSGMVVQDPSEGNDINSIFEHARQMGATEIPYDEMNASSGSRNFTGTGRVLSSGGEAAPSNHPRPPPESIVHNIIFWNNGFTVNEGPLRSMDDPENAAFLQSIRRSECPAELEPADRRSAMHVQLIRRNEDCPVPERCTLPFQGAGRTLGSSSVPVHEGEGATGGVARSGSSELVVDGSLPSTSVQIRLADGTRMIANFNCTHNVGHIRAFIDASRPGGAPHYQLQTVGFPSKLLTDPTVTIQDAGLMNSVVIQKL